MSSCHLLGRGGRLGCVIMRSAALMGLWVYVRSAARHFKRKQMQWRANSVVFALRTCRAPHLKYLLVGPGNLGVCRELEQEESASNLMVSHLKPCRALNQDYN